MNQKLQQSINAGLRFLSQNQQDNGSFLGKSSDDLVDFSAFTHNDNIFFTALILSCLNCVDNSASITVGAINFLLGQRSESWSWNYWTRGSDSMLKRQYPDDLDDTACSLAAIWLNDPAAIDASALAKVAQNLISCETKIGGPYTTWLVPASANQWRDVDVAVNANIGYMLKALGAQSLELEAYITDCLQNDNLESPYYVGITPTLYFMARWYNGPALNILRSKVMNELESANSLLHISMLVTSAIRLGLADMVSGNVINQLIGGQVNGAWSAEALYFEPPANGKQYYAGSSELSTAFAIEALSLLRAKPELPKLAPASLEIDDMAGVFARAIGCKISPRILNMLNSANKLGWQAYTIYDDFLDDEGQPLKLSAANKAHRRCVQLFNQALDYNQEFEGYTQAAFDAMDDANYWEVSQARDINSLPDYGNYKQLAQRSWGQTITPVGVLLAASYNIKSPTIRSTLKFMQHYIIAKQLSDDAHDWQDDLAHNRYTSAVTLLLGGCSSQNMSELSKYFWENTILDINLKIRQNLRLAEQALEECNFDDPAVLNSWLARLEQACVKSEQGRAQALEFIQTFTSPALV